MSAVSADCEKIGACGCTHTHAPTCASNWNLWQLCEHFWPGKIWKLPSSVDDKCVSVRGAMINTLRRPSVLMFALVMKVRIRITSTRVKRDCANVHSCMGKDVLNDSKWRQYWHLKCKNYLWEVLKCQASKISPASAFFPFRPGAIFMSSINMELLVQLNYISIWSQGDAKFRCSNYFSRNFSSI
jgi:hypothetical protein